MQITWTFDGSDTDPVLELRDRLRDNWLVRQRIAQNVRGEDRPELSRETLWHALVSCLLTTQQRSGPSSAVNRFITTKPFSLALSRCMPVSACERTVVDVLRSAGGIRRWGAIAETAAHDLRWLEEEEGWLRLEAVVRGLEGDPDPARERAAARSIQSWLRGFGPKQSRNYLQMLALTRYETPIDSRVIKWLRGVGFPVPLVSDALGNEDYYEFVMDGLQQLCKTAGVLPCVFDALVFAEVDGNAWRPENLLW